MGRYNKMREVLEKDKAFKKEQKRLHDKHEAVPSDKVIVEKSTAIKHILSFTRIAIKTLTGIVLIILCAIGVITLVYPNIRVDFFIVIKDMLNELKNMI